MQPRQLVNTSQVKSRATVKQTRKITKHRQASSNIKQCHATSSNLASEFTYREGPRGGKLHDLEICKPVCISMQSQFWCKASRPANLSKMRKHANQAGQHRPPGRVWPAHAILQQKPAWLPSHLGHRTWPQDIGQGHRTIAHSKGPRDMGHRTGPQDMG